MEEYNIMIASKALDLLKIHQMTIEELRVAREQQIQDHIPDPVHHDAIMAAITILSKPLAW